MLVALTGLVPVGVVSVLVAALLMVSGQSADAGACGVSGPGVVVDPATVPPGVAGYDHEQLTNAAYVMNAGAALGLSVTGQTIGVMVAMGESSLRVVDYGDTAGPDSRGLFQQRANGAWGSYEDRMDPTISATNFFRALMRVEGWETRPVDEMTLVAHEVQGNSDPNYYTPFWDPAVQVVDALSGSREIAASNPGRVSTCGAGESIPVGPGGWVKPAEGPVTSGFGSRWGSAHEGTDVGAACDAPIYAAASGTVVEAGPSSGYGNLIAVDHGGGGVVTRYAHMYDPGVLVRVGQRVRAGEQIGRVGNAGDSTACHLHFEVLVDGVPWNPQPFMSERGAPLGDLIA